MNLLPTEGGEGGGEGGGKGRKGEKGWKRVKSNEHPVRLNKRPGHSIE